MSESDKDPKLENVHPLESRRRRKNLGHEYLLP